jgi:hypothetical protein
MKGIQGLILAIGLGVVGAIFNWMYLNNRASQEETVRFLGIKAGRTINCGDTLRDEDLVPVEIPERWAGNLKDFVFTETAQRAVVGEPVSRTIVGGHLLWREDLKPPRPELKLEEGETAQWIPVDTRTFVPSLLMPGDTVSFLVSAPSVPTPATPGRQHGGERDGDADFDKGGIGPFKVLAVGNRLGSPEAMRAAKLPQLQESVLAIRVSDRVPGEREKFKKLWELLQATNFRQVAITLHSRKAN